MSKEALIKGLQEALNREISTATRYLLQGAAIKGRQNEAVRDLYRAEVVDEIGHAQYLADKLAELGVKPLVSGDFSPIPDNVDEMIKNDIAAEEKDIFHYKKLAELAEAAGEIEIKLQMEEQAADESRHSQSLRRLQGK